jgi:hypothetical protein
MSDDTSQALNTYDIAEKAYMCVCNAVMIPKKE